MGVLGLSLSSACGVWMFFIILAAYYVTGRSDLFFSELLHRESAARWQRRHDDPKDQDRIMSSMEPADTQDENRRGLGILQDMWVIIRTGIPAGLHNTCEMFRTIVVNAVVMHYVTSVGLSALAAVSSVMNVMWTIPFGMLAVSRMLIGLSILAGFSVAVYDNAALTPIEIDTEAVCGKTK